MYSHRLSWPLLPNSYSECVADLKRLGTPLLDLTISNPTKANFDYPHRAITAALGAIPDTNYDPEPFGHPEAIAAIQAYYEERGFTVDSARILLTASTSEAYGYLLKLLCDAGDEILVPLPSYPLFEYLAALESVHLAPYWLRYDGSWHIDFSALLGQISPRTRAIVIVNPNNPTGSLLPRDDTAKLLEIAQKHDLPVITDEVFCDYAFSALPDSTRTLVNYPHGLVFSLNGLSKTAGMPQLKLSWMVLSGDETHQKQARERLELIFDTDLSVNTPTQRALPQLLRIGSGVRQQITARVQQNLAAAQQLLHDSAAHVLHADAGWSVIVQLPRTRSEEAWLLDLLQQQHLIVQPGYFFDLPNECGIVLSLLTPPADFAEGLRRLKGLVDRT